MLKRLLGAFVIISLSFLILFPIPSNAGVISFINPLSTPFGGRILFQMPCTCSANQLLIIGPPKGGTFVMFPTVKLYENYKPDADQEVA